MTELSQNSRSRRWLLGLAYFYFFSLFLEGALRKWGLPDYNKAIYFIRDPAVLLMYLFAWKNGIWAKNDSLMFFAKFLAGSLSFLFLLQLYESRLLYLHVFGWRNAVFHLPLLFLLPVVFQKKDCENLIRFSLIMAIPVTILAVLQHNAPATDPINAGFGDYFRTFGVTGRYIRPAGPFSSVLIQGIFVAIHWVFVLGIWLQEPNDRIVSFSFLVPSSVLCIIALAVSGSRGLFVHIGATLFFLIIFMVGKTFGSLKFMKGFFIIFLFLVAGFYISNVYFEGAINALSERVIETSSNEDFGDRIFSIFSNAFIYILPKVPILGHGIGSTSNAAVTFGTIDLISEDDWSKHIYEFGPFLGLLYIFFRIYLVIFLVVKSSNVFDSSLRFIPILLSFSLFILISCGTIVANGTVGSFAWFFGGFNLALIQVGEEEQKAKSFKNE